MRVRRVHWPHAWHGMTSGLALRVGPLYLLLLREERPGLPTTFAVKAWLG